MRPAIMAGSMAIPLEHVDIAAMTRTLTATYRPMGSDTATLVEAFRLDEEYIYVPRQYGLTYCQRRRIPFEDQTSSGYTVVFPKTPQPRDYQVRVLDQLVECARNNYDYIFKAHTGWGKTIGELLVAARLGVTTLVIVDQDNLKEQWVDAMAAHFGMTEDNGHVGVVQGDTCIYQGCSVVVAMVHTLRNRTYEAEFYDYFGNVIFDEVHTVGAPSFSVVLLDFPATHRGGVSATPKRADGLQKLLDYSLGPIRVSAEKEHDESAVYVRTHPTVYSWYANVSPKVGRIITEVSEDGSRNLLVAESSMSLYESGRDTLILSDRIEQLKHTQSLLYYLGMDPDQLGLYTGYDPVYRYAKDPKPMRRPDGLVAHEDDDEFHYTPISLQLIARRVGAKELARIKSSAGMLLATYGKCAKGFDEPRLKAGVDATSRSEVEQIHGRILRVVAGSKMPVWVTIQDTNSYRLLYSFTKRIAGYLKSNGRMYLWHQDGELEECPETELIADARRRHRELKDQRIETRIDGRNTLVTSGSVKAQKKQAAYDTVNRIRSRPRV
jgi:superfamily II DNA or RNA helicase